MEVLVQSPAVARGAATRDALLDAAENLIADHGFRSPSHRMIASEAGVHVALVNYHFSSKEMLFEAAIERRASRLTELWQNALNAVQVRPAWTAEDVLAAWWRPFGAMQREADVPWSNYLCVISRIASAADGETWHQRYFGPIDREFHQALQRSLPATDDGDVEAGFRYARCLFGEVLLHRCGKTGGTCRPRGFREDDIGRLIGYLGSGMRGLSGGSSVSTT